jgi:hypothetical protein
MKTFTTPPPAMVRIPQYLYGPFRLIADAHERSISAELRVALDAYVDQQLPEAKRTLQRRKRND